MKSIIIVNPKSGRGKILKYKNYIICNLSKAYGDVVWIETKCQGDAIKIASEYGKVVDYIFVAGGDGTLNEVINGVMQNEHKPILAQIPCGTVNDFSSSLGIKKNIKKSIKQLLNSKPREVNVFRSKDKYGIYICGIGVFTKTSYTASQKKKNKFGVISYFFNGIKEIKTYKPQEALICYDNCTISTKVCLMLAINSKSVGGFKFNKNANLCDDLMDFVLISTKKDKICFSDLILIAKLFLFGIKSISKNKRVVTSKVSSFAISSKSDLLVNFDGELAGTNNLCEVKIVDTKLKFLATHNTKRK